MLGCTSEGARPVGEQRGHELTVARDGAWRRVPRGRGSRSSATKARGGTGSGRGRRKKMKQRSCRRKKKEEEGGRREEKKKEKKEKKRKKKYKKIFENSRKVGKGDLLIFRRFWSRKYSGHAFWEYGTHTKKAGDAKLWQVKFSRKF